MSANALRIRSLTELAVIEPALLTSHFGQVKVVWVARLAQFTKALRIYAFSALKDSPFNLHQAAVSDVFCIFENKIICRSVDISALLTKSLFIYY